MNTTSRVKAIHQHCKECVYDRSERGTWRQQTEACTITHFGISVQNLNTVMPDKPKTFSNRQRAPAKSVGGSSRLRDRSATYRRVCERLLAVEPLCRYCRSTGLIQAATVVDHIIALSLGGSNDPSNLAPACQNCNDRKSVDERRFVARGYDVRDIARDSSMADWLTRATKTDFTA